MQDIVLLQEIVLAQDIVLPQIVSTVQATAAIAEVAIIFMAIPYLTRGEKASTAKPQQLSWQAGRVFFQNYQTRAKAGQCRLCVNFLKRPSNGPALALS